MIVLLELHQRRSSVTLHLRITAKYDPSPSGDGNGPWQKLTSTTIGPSFLPFLMLVGNKFIRRVFQHVENRVPTLQHLAR